ncbi:MAG: RNA polymerase sigma factor [Sphingobacterium sp.]
MGTHVKDISNREFSRFKDGDPAVFRTIFDLYHKQLYGYIFNFTKSKEDAEELLQEGFLTLFLHRDKVRSASGIYPYLFVAVKRMMISEFRKKIVRAKFQDHLAYFWQEASTDTQKQLEISDLVNALDDLMKELPSKEREVYRLNKIDGLSYQEIAQQAGVSINTIKNQVRTASRKIKWKMEKIYFLLIILFFL